MTEHFGGKLLARNSNADRHKGDTSGSLTMTKQESKKAAATFHFSAEYQDEKANWDKAEDTDLMTIKCMKKIVTPRWSKSVRSESLLTAITQSATLAGASCSRFHT